MPVSLIVVAPMVALALVMAASPSEPEAGSAGDNDSELEPASQPSTVDEDASHQPTVTQIEPADAPSGGGVAGAIVDPDDPNATRAQSDLEGESLDTAIAGVPDRLPKLQAAGWWTTFGAVALATTGGILAGIAETRQDQAERLAYSFDLSTGRTTLYGPVADDYERLLRDGETYQWLGRGFIIAGAATLVAGITVFTVDAVRRRRGSRSDSARLDLHSGPGGLGLRF
jgi:hypothetical protein